MKRIPIGGGAVLLLLVAPCSVPACGFIENAATLFTFRERAARSDLVVFGTLANPREQPGNGSTDLIIDGVFKSHPVLGNKKVLKLSRYVRIDDPNKPPRVLIFCDIDKGQIDPYLGVEVQPAVMDYLKGLLALDARDHARRLRYCFDFLEHADREIATDALREFMKTTDWDLSQATRKLPAAKLRGWLKDAKTPPDRLRLYGFLLGNCGVAADAPLLHALAERLIKQDSSLQIDGILTGYALLDPAKGWAYIRALLGKPSNKFMVRYAGLRAARYLAATRPDVIGKKDLLAGMSIALGQGDLADIAVDYLRQWRCWDLTATILPLYGKASHDQNIIRRAILRYALQCPGPEAASFVAQRRIADAELVAETKELLELEAQGQ